MIILYRIYQLFIMAPVLLVATVLTALTVMAASVLGFGRWGGYYPQVVWARLFLAMTLVKVKVEGRENIDPATSYVFVANHQSAYDIFTVYALLHHNFRWMMKKELRKMPLIGLACEKSHQIYVDNSTPGALKQTMERAEALLRGGMSLVIFPEGARTLDGRMHRFKRGAFILAEEFHLPVVPLTIDGAYRVLPRNKTLPHWGRITLTIHKPITPGREDHTDTSRIMQEAWDAIQSSLPVPGDQKPAR